MALRPATLKVYSKGLKKFCSEMGIDPFEMPNMKLEDIEDMTEQFIMSNQGEISAKYLNVIYASIKTWCYVHKLIKNRKLFRELKFDRTSRKNDALKEMPLEPHHVKAAFQISDANEKVLLGLYGIEGLRPKLIPQLTVAQIHPEHYTIENGQFKFTVKNPFVFIPKEWQGNKAHITFFVILHSQLAELIEQTINIDNDNVTTKTPLTSKYRTESNIHHKVIKIYSKIGFKGRPYLLRTFADRILDKTIADEDLKEFMMGHKGKVSAIYQFKQLTKSDIEDYTTQYQATEQLVNEKVFGIIAKERLGQAEQIKRFAVTLGVNEAKAQEIFELLQKGKMSLTEYEKELADMTKRTQEQRMKETFEAMWLEMNHKHNGGS